MRRNFGMTHWRVAQSVEQGAVNARVAGSSPASSAKFMSGPAGLRGVSTDRPTTRDEILPRDSNSFATASPPDASWPNSEGSNLPLFVSSSHPLERSKAAQTFIDCLAVTFGILFLCTTAASIPVALFLLIFCKF